MGIPFGFSMARGGFQLAFPNAVGRAFDQGDVGVVGEAVEQGRDAGGVGEDGVPVFEGLVGGQQNRIALVAVVDDFEEQVGGVGVVSQISTFVNDQQGGGFSSSKTWATVRESSPGQGR